MAGGRKGSEMCELSRFSSVELHVKWAMRTEQGKLEGAGSVAVNNALRRRLQIAGNRTVDGSRMAVPRPRPALASEMVVPLSREKEEVPQLSTDARSRTPPLLSLPVHFLLLFLCHCYLRLSSGSFFSLSLPAIPPFPPLSCVVCHRR